MKCTRCGNEILNGSAFCGNCGQPVNIYQAQNQYTGSAQPAYQVPPQNQYTGSAQPAYQAPPQNQYTGSAQPAYQAPPAGPETIIVKIPGNIYESRNMNGGANAAGIFMLYNDRITLRPTGNAKAQAAFGLVGSAIAAKTKRKKYGDYIMFNEIRAAEIVMRNKRQSAICISLKNGQEYSFVYAVKKYGDEAQRIINYMKPRLG